jgi:hypothetical protein
MEAIVNRPPTARGSLTVPTTETSMRILEYGICVVAGAAALLLGFVR